MYALGEPKADQVDLYMKNIQDHMLSDNRTKRELIKTFWTLIALKESLAKL